MQKKINIQNKKARFEYEILDKYIAGIQLTGTEIKSIRQSKARITESFCEFNERGELFVVNMYIEEYAFGNHYNHNPKSERRLLLNKQELKKLAREVESKGNTIVPLRLFINENGWAKLEIALAKGKKTHDKRQVIKDRDSKRDLARLKKNSKEAKVAVQVTSRRRIVRKRDAATGVITNNYSHKLATLKKKTEIVNNISVDKNTGMKVIPFNYVDEVPLFKNCETVPVYKQEKCFKAELASHIKKNLRYPEKEYDRGVQGRVFVHFIINKEGNVDKMKIVSPYKGEALGKEAERIMKKLPKLQPGKHSGIPVTVKYGLPITFRIPGVKPSNIRKTPKKEAVAKVYSFDEVSQIPQFSNCNNSGDSSLNCFNTNLVEHIQDNFAYPTEAVEKNIEGKVFVNFVINTKGEVVNISAKGPANAIVLEKAATELVAKLPEFKAAVKNGKKVNTRYSFPVMFKLN